MSKSLPPRSKFGGRDSNRRRDSSKIEQIKLKNEFHQIERRFEAMQTECDRLLKD